MLSNPPRHGAAIVVEVLSDPRLYAEWRVRKSLVSPYLKFSPNPTDPLICHPSACCCLSSQLTVDW